MNKFVRKVKTMGVKNRRTSALKTSIPKGKGKPHKESKEKKGGKEKNDVPKLTTKERLRALFNIRGNKKQDNTATSKSTMRTQMTELENIATNAELERLKNDLKAGSARDQAIKWVDLMLDKGIVGLELELDRLNKSAEKPKSISFDANADRNLSQEIICQDDNRVLLKDDTNNYIHANYVNTPNNDKHFICTQRPMETTVESFYKMILQEQVEYIVMLCNFTENMEKKCPEYFPQAPTDKPMTFGTITVKCTHANEMKSEPNVVITGLEVKGPDGKALAVEHYNWRSWPERGFPDPTSTIFNLMCAVRNSKKPIVVHCSDGVGRTGVFVAIEYMMEKLQRGEGCADTVDLVKEIRSQRAMAVKTISQYIVLHRLLLQFFQELQIADMSQRLLEFIDDYDAFTKKHVDVE